MKIDTQGTELEVLEGSADILSEVLAMQIELSSIPVYDESVNMLEVLAALSDYHYKPTGFFPITRARDSATIEFDAVLIQRSKHAPS